jgi:uncharacterized protein (DUF433 family)
MSPVVTEILQQIDRLSPAEQTQILQHLSQSPNIIPRIEKTPGVVGGDACIVGTRLPVWELVQYRQMGASNYKILEAYPQLTELDLQIAWEYNHNFPEEIAAAIAANEAA